MMTAFRNILFSVLLISGLTSHADNGTSYHAKIIVNMLDGTSKEGYVLVHSDGFSVEEKSDSLILFTSFYDPKTKEMVRKDHGTLGKRQGGDYFFRLSLNYAGRLFTMSDTIRLYEGLTQIFIKQADGYSDYRLIKGHTKKFIHVSKVSSVEIQALIVANYKELLPDLSDEEAKWFNGRKAMFVSDVGRDNGICWYDAWVFEGADQEAALETIKSQFLQYAYLNKQMNDYESAIDTMTSEERNLHFNGQRLADFVREYNECLQQIEENMKKLKSQKILFMKACSC